MRSCSSSRSKQADVSMRAHAVFSAGICTVQSTQKGHHNDSWHRSQGSCLLWCQHLFPCPVTAGGSVASRRQKKLYGWVNADTKPLIGNTGGICSSCSHEDTSCASVCAKVCFIIGGWTEVQVAAWGDAECCVNSGIRCYRDCLKWWSLTSEAF